MASTEKDLVDQYKAKYVNSEYRLNDQGYWGKVLFWWTLPLLNIGSKVAFEQSMHSNLKIEDSANTCHQMLHEAWKMQRTQVANPQTVMVGKYLYMAIFTTFKVQLTLGYLLGIFTIVADYMSANVSYLSLGKFNEYKPDLSNPNKLYYEVAILESAIAISSFLAMTFESIKGFYLANIGMRISAGIKCLIFDKMLKKSTKRE